MTTEQAHYQHDLGNGLFLDAYSIDPSIGTDTLRQMVVSKDGKPEPNLEELVSNIIFVERVSSVDDMQIEISDKQYEVPEQLQDYRQAVQFQSDSAGRYNGPVLIADEKVQIPLKTFRGGFYDFISTKLDNVPSALEHEFEILNMLPEGSLFWRAFSKVGGEKKAREIYNRLKGKYEKGKTIGELFDSWNISHDKRTKYLGFAYLALTDNGRELSFVQRAKGMAIAADCISSPGSTPNPPFDEPGFNINKYLQGHMIEEMSEEYNLNPQEFKINNIYLFDDKRQVPFGAVEMVTPLKTRELAERIYGKEGAIKEHPVLYSMRPEAIHPLIERFPIFPSFIQVMRVFDKHRKDN